MKSDVIPVQKLGLDKGGLPSFPTIRNGRTDLPETWKRSTDIPEVWMEREGIPEARNRNADSPEVWNRNVDSPRAWNRIVDILQEVWRRCFRTREAARWSAVTEAKRSLF